ncbi:membrane protein-like protein [Exiguobacterium sibiricum 255-15]|uniref:Membrane protein-like protein n=1 Tax=Exiguobacterium sibiricum (strain DSM 17290 / CCUG 55495 / CIP 109462 / JCM 13490 / 255-15) TaxID=262543 RepID=B1YJI2_EXIS2|nr:DUF2254 domain-containing protein [Exiguobacterium sibiricum]ACB60012.1 membrane protein-like protein [Exiguobacterium sibiricum 255-15]
MQKLKLVYRETNWWWPLLYGVGGAVLTAVVLMVDLYAKELFPNDWKTTLGLAQTIHSAVFTGLLTMMTFTFSTILVVLTTYSSQFSPRTLPNFIENRQVQHIFGIFIGTVTYSITMLFFMRSSLKDSVVASAVAVIVVLIAVIAFVAFVHIVSQSIRVTTLLDRLHEEGCTLIEEHVEAINGGQYQLVPENRSTYSFGLTALQTGYLQAIDYELLMKSGERVAIEVTIGSYVTQGQRIGSAEKENVEQGILVGPTRSAEQDFAFVIQKLSEVALRAISPGINDPNTARHAMRQIGDLFRRYTMLLDGNLLVNGEGSVTVKRLAFSELLYLTFYQLRHYGEEDISVLSTMLESLEIMKRNALPEHRASIDRFIPFVCSEVDWSALNDWDRQHLEQAQKRALS